MGFALLHQAMQIPRLVGAVEIAQTNVNNSRGQIATIIVRDFHTAGKFGQR